LSEIASALYACHEKQPEGRVLHRDLKPSNIFLSSLNGHHDKRNLSELSVKLGDFGLARVLHDQSVFAFSHVGTPYYMPPEQIQFRGYDDKSDIWSLGCILYEMATLKPPFRANRYTQLAQKIQKGEYKALKGISEELASLISCMLKKDPLERPTIEKIWQIPRVQCVAKRMRVERRHAAASKMERNNRIKDREIREQNIKLTSEQKRLDEEKLRLKERSLELKRYQRRLNTMEQFLLGQARELGLTLPSKSEITNKMFHKRREDSQRKILTFAWDGNGQTDGCEDKVSRKSSGYGESSSTPKSRSWSFSCLSSPEKPGEYPDNTIFSCN